MKLIRLIFSIVLTLIVFYLLNTSNSIIGSEVPPLGKLLNPFMGFWQNGEVDNLNLPAELDADQLSETVTVQFDEQLIPHIFAQNDYDLYFTQGYITAYHRLWQMEFQVMVAEGRVSELVGEKGIKHDRTQRRKGIKYAAQRSLTKARKNTNVMTMINGYTDGINHFIDEIGYKELPIEYKLLNYVPEPWTALKCFILMKYKADMLSSDEADLENTNALKLFGRKDFDLLFPERFKTIDPIIPAGTKWNFTPVKVDDPNISFPLEFTKETIAKPDPSNGSNNFAVNGTLTANGRVLLANEPDLGLNLPSLWYIAQLHTPKMNVMGATLPGLPGVVIGFTDSIAWGITNAKRDVVDWYKIQFRNDQRKEYLYNGKWFKTEKVIEKILVKNGDVLYDTIVHTHFGPVVYDWNFLKEEGKSDFAMKWTAHEESLEIEALYLINRAKNKVEFEQSIKSFHAPAQNFAFASAKGEIGIIVNGRFPIKWKEQGKFLMDGTDVRQEWASDIPFEQHASIFNPVNGFVSSANQHPVDSLYPYYTYDYNYEFYRNRRINDRLRLMQNVTPEDMMKLQNDNYNYRAYESLPIMLEHLDTINLTPAAMKVFMDLRGWDYFNEYDRFTPTIYEIWWNNLYAMIWDEFDDQNVALIKPHIFNTIHLMIKYPENKFFDIVNTSEKETLHQLINLSFNKALADLEDWKSENGEDYQWYLYKNTKLSHLLKLEAFSQSGVKIGGNKNIVNAASGNHGPSWRMVVELGKGGARAWGVYPGSQSGNPGNPTYGQMIDNWAKGIYYPLNFLKSAEEENSKKVFNMKFNPE